MGKLEPARGTLIARVRAMIADEPQQREVSMFGGRSFMVREKMIVSTLKQGSLLVRVNAEQHEQLLTRPGATQAEMGSGREMGPGWIEVAASAIEAEEDLRFWIDVALDYNREVTAS